jgi:hypothetical protein
MDRAIYLTIAATAFFGVVGYAADQAMTWQKEQDSRLLYLDKMIERQKTLLELQIQYNSQAVQSASGPYRDNITPYGHGPNLYMGPLEYNQ